MSKDFPIIQIVIDEQSLARAPARIRNQIAGCMHAHNELTVLYRLSTFSMNKTGDGTLHDSAQAIQMWCLLQVLSGKIVESWLMIVERFLKANPPDDAVTKLSADQKASLDWLKNYFGVDTPLKDSALKLIRDKTAFHYDRLNLEGAISNLGPNENIVYLAQHPANSVYYLGSALVFRAIFEKIAEQPQNNDGSPDKVRRGALVAIDDAEKANFHMHVLLYGLMRSLFDESLGKPLEIHDQVRIDIKDAVNPDDIGLPTFVHVGSGQ